ncbi:MAG: hypothetical protein ABIB04_03890 [Patescibacteria group bacterium]
MIQDWIDRVEESKKEIEMIKFEIANIVTSFSFFAIGTKVLDREGLLTAAAKAVEAHDPSGDRQPGQHFVLVPDGVRLVSAGVGRRTDNPDDYVVRKGRFAVDCYLRREKAAKVEGLALVVYTRDAYLADPDLQKPEEAEERARIEQSDCTHVIVAVLAFAGPQSPLPPSTFIHNLAGGNLEVEKWSKEEICEKAAQIEAYWNDWCIVAD